MNSIFTSEKFKNLIILVETVLLLFLVASKFPQINSKNIDSTPSPIAKVEQELPNDELIFPPLNLPEDYFESSRRNIGAGAYSTLQENDQFFRSYPSKKITLSSENYSVIPKDLPPIKTYNQIHTEIPEADFMGEAKEQSIKKYGDLARRYAGDPAEGSYIHKVDYADLDKDGTKEQIVNWTEMGANVIGGKTIVIKNSKEIFSTSQSTFSILRPATDSNGFYLEWDDNHKMRDGYVVTRFVFEKNEFKPIYEQQIRYIRIK